MLPLSDPLCDLVSVFPQETSPSPNGDILKHFSVLPPAGMYQETVVFYSKLFSAVHSDPTWF